MTNPISPITKRSKVQAVNVITGEVRKDVGNPDGPRIYTVESTDNNEIKLFQVGTYEIPLKFSLETGLPYLAEHSRSSTLYKTWKNYRILSYASSSE
jgi:hypothetical protein